MIIDNLYFFVLKGGVEVKVTSLPLLKVETTPPVIQVKNEMQSDKKDACPPVKDVMAKFNTKFKGKNLEIPSTTNKGER